jgi:hypothetical protein
MGLNDAVREASLGPVVRVHRRYPTWEHLQLSLYGLALLFFLAGVPVFALWLNHWRFLPGVLFVVGCLALSVLAAPWYLAATRGERYAVTELGVLVWSPRRNGTSRAITWRGVLRVKGREITWRDAEERRQYLTVPPMTGRRDLLAAFERGMPVPAGVASRVGPPAVAAVLVLPALGALVWWGAVPTAAELIRGERPEDVFALSRVCDGGDPFRGSAPYRGQGPHPIAVVDEGVTDHVAGVATPGGNWPPGHVMQLVACGRQIGRASPDALASCPYTPVLGGSGYLVKVYQGRYEYDVREARTGRPVATMTVDGDTAGECGSSWFATENSPRTMEVDRPPSDAQLDVAFAALVDGPAPG